MEWFNFFIASIFFIIPSGNKSSALVKASGHNSQFEKVTLTKYDDKYDIICKNIEVREVGMPDAFGHWTHSFSVHNGCSVNMTVKIEIKIKINGVWVTHNPTFGNGYYIEDVKAYTSRVFLTGVKTQNPTDFKMKILSAVEY